MKRAATFLLIVAAACGSEAPVPTGTVDTREPIGIRYVGTQEIAVRAQPNDTAPVLSTYQSGEAVSVLSERGEWVEIRTGETAGWTRASELTTAERKAEQEENPEPKFRVMPMPVTAPSAKGEIYLEADVNSDGEVISIRTITNTTGSDALAEQNAQALRNAKFHPIVVRGERRPFKYYHRVTY